VNSESKFSVISEDSLFLNAGFGEYKFRQTIVGNDTLPVDAAEGPVIQESSVVIGWLPNTTALPNEGANPKEEVAQNRGVVNPCVNHEGEQPRRGTRNASFCTNGNRIFTTSKVQAV